jgi:hypothetical protein
MLPFLNRARRLFVALMGLFVVCSALPAARAA